MLLKLVVIAILFIILYCLMSALYYLLYRKDSTHMVKALTWRIVISVSLFLFLLLAYSMGWLHPHGVLPYSHFR